MTNMLKKIRNVLEKNRFEVYYPGQHKGDCLSPYLVVKQAGTQDIYGISSEQNMYEILCYVPEKNYSKLEETVFATKQAMKELFPIMVYAGFQTESVYDESNKSYMVSFMYRNVRRILNY